MKKTGKKSCLFLLICSFLSFQYLSAQDPLFIAKASKYKVSKYEEFEISFTINAQGSGFKEPNNLREYFTVISGPNSSTFTSFGTTGMRIEQTYSFIVIPKRTGKFTISEASINVGGKTIKSKPFDIEVLDQIYDEKVDPNDPKYIAKNLAFIRVKVERNSYYVGEVFTVDYLLFYRTGIGNIEILSEPNFKGFYTEVVKEQLNPYQEVVNGELFNVAVLKRLLLFGQKPGKYNLGSLEVRIPTEIQTNQRDFFNPFFRSSKIVNQVSIYQLPTITIKELPPYNYNNPFSGGVGKFKFKANITKSQVNAGDAFSLKLSVEGNGNLKLIQLPDVEFPFQFDVFEPKKSDKISITSKGMVGSREVEYILIPKYNGEYKLPPIHFSYFDPSLNKYILQVEEDLFVKVTGGEQYVSENSGKRAQNFQKDQTNLLQKDIMFIKLNSDWSKVSDNSFSRRIFLWWTSSVLVVFLTLGILSFFKNKIWSEVQNKRSFKKQIIQAFLEAEKFKNNPKDCLNYLNQRLTRILEENKLNSDENHTAVADKYKLDIIEQFRKYSKLINEYVFSGKTNEDLLQLYQEIKAFFSQKLNTAI